MLGEVFVGTGERARGGAGRSSQGIRREKNGHECNYGLGTGNLPRSMSVEDICMLKGLEHHWIPQRQQHLGRLLSRP